MRTKVAEHIKIINTRVPEELDKFIITYCTERNISKSEFVRDAVEHYINYLTDKNREELYQALLEIGEKDYEN